MFRPYYSLIYVQHFGEQVPDGGRISRQPGKAGELAAGDQGVWMLRAEYLLLHGQHLGEHVPGTDRVAR